MAKKGPQAEILTPGWHPWFLVNVIYQVENKKVVSIPSGKYGFLNAKDGVPLRPDQYLADAFPAGRESTCSTPNIFDPWRRAGAADDDADAGELPSQHVSMGHRHQGRGRYPKGFCRRHQIQRRHRGQFRQYGLAKAELELLSTKAGVRECERRSRRRRSEEARTRAS